MIAARSQRRSCSELISNQFYLCINWDQIAVFPLDYWQRDSSGNLLRGILHTLEKCPTRFLIYEPHNLSTCPHILIISRGSHNHPNPPPTKTPLFYENLFRTWLQELGWQLADATPRKIVLNPAFMKSLREFLKWSPVYDPSLSELHASLENKDHTAWIINDLRQMLYSSGMGLEGMVLLNIINTSIYFIIRSQRFSAQT